MTLTNSLNGFDGAQELLIKLVEQSPEEWETRKRVVQVLYDAGKFRDASKLVWNAPEIPPVAEEMVFTARIVAKGQPERAVRLLSTVVERNMGNPAENLIMAKLLMEHGLTLQALRFYGAATAEDKTLIDESFELALVKTDSSEDVWKDVAKADDFPWPGPRDIKISDIMTDDGKGDMSAADVLLSSVTQRVPLKAPTQQPDCPAESLTEQSDTAGQAAVSEALAAVSSSSSMLSPAAEALVKKMRDQGSSSEEIAASLNATSEQTNGSFSSMVSFFKSKEEEVGAPTRSPVASQPMPESSAPAAPTPPPTGSAAGTKKPTPSSSLIQDFKPTPSGALKTVVPDPAPITKSAQEAPAPQAEPPQAQASESPSAPAPSAAQPPAAQNGNAHPEPTSVSLQQEAKEETASPFSPDRISQPLSGDLAPPSFDVTAQAASPFSAEAHSSAPVPQEDPNPPSTSTDDLSDVVADALAEREAEQPKSKNGGFLSKCRSLFGKNKSQEDSAEFTAESGTAMNGAEETPSTQTGSIPEKRENGTSPMSLKSSDSKNGATAAQSSSAQSKQPEPISRASIEGTTSTPVPRKPESNGHEPPRELDGRTQLVALAPRDGNSFFEQLLKKYNALPEGQVSQAAAIARDMANLDYLGLIHAACSKDLDAFSKLLGLHRVMSDARCYDWVNDMDLLRKGYGDAVLATVVSKYSVEECREILSAVYQQAPAVPTQAVAG